MTAQDVIKLVYDKTGLEPVKCTEDVGYLRIVGRLHTGWQPLRELFRYLNNNPDHTWTADTSRWYFTIDRQDRFAYRIILQSDGPLPFERIAKYISAFRPETQPQGGGPLAEIRLGKASASRNVVSKEGKGAAPMGKARVGAAFRRSD